ncbi:hypothetical protein [Bosea sp. TAF32]|uniref:hypothetical protein n=1 Tax=Bosea sp. TAF32 TaxID=3237482 RepID=UPI003F93EA4F
MAGAKDYRLIAYRDDNATGYPLVTGDIFTPRIATPAQYQTQILDPLYDSLANVDREGILRHPWLNSRGEIPRFDSNAIEISLTDTQESVAADLAVAGGRPARSKHCRLQRCRGSRPWRSATDPTTRIRVQRGQ